MALRKYKQDKKIDAYSSHDILKRVKSSEDWTYLMKTQFKSDKFGLAISTQVSGWWIFNRRWLLVLDCDSRENKDKALEELHILKIKHKLFLSSINHYWVITDYVGKFWSCINFMEAIPGVDNQFISFCKEYRKIFLRAYPKDGYRPHLSEDFDAFRGVANRWVELFKYYWNSSPDVEWVIKKQQEQIQRKTEAKIAEQLIEERQEVLRQEELEKEKNKRKRFFRFGGEINV